VNRDAMSRFYRFGAFYPHAAMGYHNGLNLYRAYFAPRGLDPSGYCTDECTELGALQGVWSNWKYVPQGKQNNGMNPDDIEDAKNKVDNMDTAQEVGDALITGGQIGSAGPGAGLSPGGSVGTGVGVGGGQYGGEKIKPDPSDLVGKVQDMPNIGKPGDGQAVDLWIKVKGDVCKKVKCDDKPNCCYNKWVPSEYGYVIYPGNGAASDSERTALLNQSMLDAFNKMKGTLDLCGAKP